MTNIRVFLPLLIILGSLSFLQAQTPKYWIGYPKVYGQSFGFYGQVTDTMASIKLQSIYYPSDFPTARSGMLTHVYFRVGGGSAYGTPKVYSNFAVRKYTHRASRWSV